MLQMLAESDGGHQVYWWICVGVFICGVIASPYIRKLIAKFRKENTSG